MYVYKSARTHAQKTLFPPFLFPVVTLIYVHFYTVEFHLHVTDRYSTSVLWNTIGGNGISVVARYIAADDVTRVENVRHCESSLLSKTLAEMRHGTK